MQYALRAIYSALIYVESKKNDTNKLILKTEIDSQTQKTNVWLPQGKEGGRDKLGFWD